MLLRELKKEDFSKPMKPDGYIGLEQIVSITESGLFTMRTTFSQVKEEEMKNFFLIQEGTVPMIRRKDAKELDEMNKSLEQKQFEDFYNEAE